MPLRGLPIRIAATIVCTTAGTLAAVQTPASIRSVYGFDKVSATGAGQTIAVIIPYSDPSAATDLAYFSAHYGLPAASLTIVNSSGGSALPDVDPTANHTWEIETALDLQYAHATAPGANLLLVNADSSTYASLFAAVNYAKSQPGVSAITMSLGGSEFTGISYFDTTFNQAASHAGVTFVAASGDKGASGGLSYPASSPHVLAVGGTSLGANGETAWSGSGGGSSNEFATPTYQKAAWNDGTRGVPDVAYDADPSTGFSVYSTITGSTTTGDANFLQVGGTSAGSPQWAGLITLANEERVDHGLPVLTGDQTLSMLYALYGTDYYAQAFNDITAGSNGYSAGVGYDLVTGLGSPKADFLVPYLAGQIAIPEPASIATLSSFVLILRRRRCA